MRNVVAVIVVVALLAVLAGTNPTRDDLVAHLKAAVKKDNGPVVGWLGAQVSGLVVSGNVSRLNLGLLSIYRFKWPSGEPGLYVGLLNGFIKIR